MAKATLIGLNSQTTEVEVGESIYREAKDAKLSVSVHLERKFGAHVDYKVGSVMEQLREQAGISLGSDPVTGIGSATMAEVLEGSTGLSASLTRDAVPLSRILTPTTVLDMINIKLEEDMSSDVAQFNKMIGQTITIAGKNYERPIIDMGKAGDARSNATSQLALPNLMGQLTVSETTGTIPRFSIGMEISDEARNAFTFDQVAKILSYQAEKEQLARVQGYWQGLINGDIDNKQTALPKVKISTFDPNATGGKITHEGIVRWLRSHRKYATFDYLVMDLSTYFKFINREGRPLVNNVPVANEEYMNYISQVVNGGTENPKIYLVDDGVLPTDVIVGLDTRYAITKMRNSEADYQAAEELVMRRGSQLRFDFGEVVFRNYDQAWSMLELS